MSMGVGSLTVNVLNEEQEPLWGATVFCNFPRSFLAMFPINSERKTDADGIAEFDQAPAVEIEVYVNGSMEMVVEIERDEHTEITITLY